ncbi:hypothetical protein [Lutibacter sp. B1]|uniref:hypothetical protein n=1 Tax=Lutibacter sp. B1 TaxID=2725996 RepID=UPI001456D013|nr:hypothetical protein [Lutibacter sp. B1]NLP58228.1 hypothetical protein [Lutibacter sp. B1]
MKNLLKIALFITTIYLLPVNSFSQIDSSKTAKKPQEIDNELTTVKSNNQLNAKSLNTKVPNSSNIDLNSNNKLNENAVVEQLKKSNTNSNNSNFLMETLPEDRDIIGKKYWKGQDVTNKRLESNLGLGTIYSTSKTVRIECRDHSYVDGDIIKIFINEKPIDSKIALKGNYYVLYVNLEQGYNRIDFQAMNQGLSGPNTAELNVYDDKGNLISAKEWNLPTGYIATLGIIKK